MSSTWWPPARICVGEIRYYRILLPFLHPCTILGWLASISGINSYGSGADYPLAGCECLDMTTISLLVEPFPVTPSLYGISWRNHADCHFFRHWYVLLVLSTPNNFQGGTEIPAFLATVFPWVPYGWFCVDEDFGTDWAQWMSIVWKWRMIKMMKYILLWYNFVVYDAWRSWIVGLYRRRRLWPPHLYEGLSER